MKPLLEHNNIEINLTHDERKPDTAKVFIGTIKITIYKNMAAVSKNVYIDKLDEIVDKCNSIYRRTKKLKPVDVKLCKTYTEFDVENNDKDPKFKVGDHVRMFW